MGTGISTGVVEDQPSAQPYANWNERVTAECYEPNTRAQILNDDGSVRAVINNYEHISSDWGPTLLRWLEVDHPETYRSILHADRESVRAHSGHGSTLAHAYNHTILPLSNRRDKRTQVLWGIADFEHRFGRSPEGMWLPETAVDLETLEILSDAGISFTVLAPTQAASVLVDDGWLDVTGGRIDGRFPYTVRLFGGKEIDVFFYNGPLSQEIAFNGVLEDGSLLATRLTEGLGEDTGEAVLAHVATDGETYGHHHRHGEMALARAIEILAAEPDVALTNYAEFLVDHPPTRLVRIIEDSSWSCAHGVERWRADCGCATGEHPDWNQGWRLPLRQALDYLRDASIETFEEVGATLLQDPWEARDRYVQVILGRDADSFLTEHGRRLDDSERRRVALDMLEIQHQAMLMYTSCGWFFDDISGLESVLVLRHAGRVIDLTRRVCDNDLEPGFLEILGNARSNVAGRNGADIYREYVAPFLTSESESTSGRRAASR
jgi:alpha-amylase/alpha-mannosidase (GH57 family)